MSARKKAEKGYQSFHGKNSLEVGQTDFKMPKVLIYLGDAIEVTYRCDKKNGGGDGLMATYTHKCGKGNILCTDESRKNLFILGPKQRINSRGIVD